MRKYEIKQAFKNLPDTGLPDNEHGMIIHDFICWHGNGKCLRTEMREVQK